MNRPADGTRAHHNRLALVFDFDLTLAPGGFGAVLQRFGLDYPGWEQDRLAPMIEDGWDEIQAKGAELRRLSAEADSPVTEQVLADIGRRLDPYPGCMETLTHLKALGAQASGGAEVELYILSSGFTDIMVHTPIADCFTDIWGSSLFFDDQGRVDGVKRAIISIEKARYLKALAKGLDLNGANEPEGVDLAVPEAQWRVPLDQMLYVGDGASDIPAFDQVQRAGGLALGVVHGKNDWSTARRIHEDAKVENIAAPDFSPGAPLRRLLETAVDILARRVALRRIGAADAG